ncbi:hypothetical protein PAXRUDRAFT_144569 [Paxillus rubicundulus Ve08.2h10]|uniref:Peptide hydrolase n=1 Tax=Paxillus rubicundulus Ve08.2h10 TaxID=930991 RepID=A0A0D0DVQ7_9AGAM|nr:hypothetical protein PAXRUDRAFT_144569 [Paxillus rubicundulus Ve08.2h10]
MRVNFLRCLGLKVLIIMSCSAQSNQVSTLGQRDLKQLTAEQITTLATFVDPVKNIDTRNPNSHLSKLLIPRPVGSENSTVVRQYITATLTALDWHIEEDSFTDYTPYGQRSFTNIIATKDPTASRRVIVSAHYDSKFFLTYPENQFVGATDSAAPCAMMLDLAEALNPLLARRKEGFEDDEEEFGNNEDIADTTIQLVFFDGEEAFKDWTDADSVYGARHLSEKWSTTNIPPNSKRRVIGHSMTEIGTIEHLILLDLLGAPNPTIRSYFIDTAWLFDAMASAERRLHEAGMFADSGDAQAFRSFFLPRKGNQFNYGYIGDDHVPFLRKGVNILHVIANPFPSVWHTLRDDATALDIPTMRRWNLILRVFMTEYLGLQPEPAHLASIHDHIRRSENELVRVPSCFTCS